MFIFLGIEIDIVEMIMKLLIEKIYEIRLKIIEVMKLKKVIFK